MPESCNRNDWSRSSSMGHCSKSSDQFEIWVVSKRHKSNSTSSLVIRDRSVRQQTAKKAVIIRLSQALSRSSPGTASKCPNVI